MGGWGRVGGSQLYAYISDDSKMGCGNKLAAKEGKVTHSDAEKTRHYRRKCVCWGEIDYLIGAAHLTASSTPTPPECVARE